MACLIVKMRLDLPYGDALLLALLGKPAGPARPSSHWRHAPSWRRKLTWDPGTCISAHTSNGQLSATARRCPHGMQSLQCLVNAKVLTIQECPRMLCVQMP